jgi:hypothetical protein
VELFDEQGDVVVVEKDNSYKYTMEKKAETLFRRYTKQLVRKLGRHPLTDQEIDFYCKTTFPKWRGCYPQDAKFDLKPGYYIINNDVSSGPGIHWVGLILTQKTAYIYDSFARDSKKLLKHLTKRLSGKKIKIIDADRSDSEQRVHEIICGHLSLSWLHVANDLGIRAAIKI